MVASSVPTQSAFAAVTNINAHTVFIAMNLKLGTGFSELAGKRS